MSMRFVDFKQKTVVKLTCSAKMYPVSDCGPETIACETLVDAVMFSRRFVVGQDQRTAPDHLFDAESVDHQRLVILRPLVSTSHIAADLASPHVTSTFGA